MRCYRRRVHHTDGYEEGALRVARDRLVELERRLLELEDEMRSAIERVPVPRRESARNLVHYVALRQHDLRELQTELVKLGLSSLGRAEGSVLGSVRQVLHRAHEALAARGDRPSAAELRRLRRARGAALDWSEAKDYLHMHTREILGPRPEDRHVYVMVTAPSATEADAAWMAEMLRSGMNVLRVNCAHEGPEEWRRTIAALEQARRQTGVSCRVVMDLAGPKIRTGPVHGALQIATWKPRRDDLGRVIAPARVVARRRGAPPVEGFAEDLRLSPRALARLQVGDELRFEDARGKRRRLEVTEIDADGAILLARARAYVLTAAKARVVRAGARVGTVSLAVGGVDHAAIDVAQGEELVLGSGRAGRPPRRAADGRVREPGVVSCTLPHALDRLEVGHRVLFDDGKIEAVVERSHPRRREHHLRVVRTHRPMEKLRAEKGINLPDTVTTIPALTDEDRSALEVVVEHADAVSLSFVRRPEDVRALHEALDRLGRTDIGVVLKIETRAGFENLPRLLLEGLRRPPLAVMIARGDLAVEVGFERLAELQEEILWLCEASHVPAIWATQVLDTLARTGVPSRAEVTDAAASVGAECVMLNKGPFVADAVRMLTDILRRMEKHHFKKRSLYRKLKVSTFEQDR